MTDRYHSLTVALEVDIRSDDAQYLIDLIRNIKGVLDVTGNVVEHDLWTAERREHYKWREKILNLLKDE